MSKVQELSARWKDRRRQKKRERSALHTPAQHYEAEAAAERAKQGADDGEGVRSQG